MKSSSVEIAVVASYEDRVAYDTFVMTVVQEVQHPLALPRIGLGPKHISYG